MLIYVIYGIDVDMVEAWFFSSPSLPVTRPGAPGSGAQPLCKICSLR